MKPIEDCGAYIQIHKPVKPRFYTPDRLPDATQCAGCYIGVNDSRDGVPRVRYAISNGASWDYVARVDELPQPSQGPAVAQQFDLVPLVQAAVADMLPSFQAPLRVIHPPAIAHMPADSATEIKLAQRHIATAVLEVSDHVNILMRENADLRARIEHIERVALARVEAA
jgi:hypothetical protein